MMNRVWRREPMTKFSPRRRFECARMEQPERVRYVYDIRGTISLQMYDLLDVGTHPWKAIAARVGFAPEQIDLIYQRALGRGESPSRAFMLKWSAQNPTMRHLFEVLNDCQEYRLMDLLRPIAPLDVVEMYYPPGIESLLNGATAPPLTPVSPICNNDPLLRGPVYPIPQGRPPDPHYPAPQRPLDAQCAAPPRDDGQYAHLRHIQQQQHVNGTYGVPGVNVNGHYYPQEGLYRAPGHPHDLVYGASQDYQIPGLAYFGDQSQHAHRDNPVPGQRPTSSPAQRPATSSPAQRPSTLSQGPRLPQASSPGQRSSSTPSPGVLSTSSGHSRSVNGYHQAPPLPNGYSTSNSQMSDMGGDESGLQQYSYKEIVHGTGNWANELGEGSFGKVFKVYLNGTNYAVKIFLEPRPGEEQDMRITKAHVNELKILSRIRHPNIITLYGLSVDEDVCLIYDYMSNGNLSQRLHPTIGTGSGFESELAWRHRHSILIDAACALQFLHTMTPPTVHCNIKSTNILLDSNYRAKLGDYCLAQVANKCRVSNTGDTHISRQTTFQALNLGYTAPEVNQLLPAGGKFQARSDTFSFGVVILEVCTGLLPYDETRCGENQFLDCFVRTFHQLGSADKLIDKKRSDVPLELFRELIDLGLACAQKKKRPSMVDVHSKLNLMKHTYGDQMRASEMPVTPVPVVDSDGRVAPLGSPLSDPMSVSRSPIYDHNGLPGRSRSYDDAYSGHHPPAYGGQYDGQNEGEYSGHQQQNDEQFHQGGYAELNGAIQYMDHIIYGPESNPAAPDNRGDEPVVPLHHRVYGREFSNLGSPYAVTAVPKPEHYRRQTSNEYPSMSGVPGYGRNYPSRSDDPYDPVLEPAQASNFQSAIPSFRQSSFVHNAWYDIPDAASSSRNVPRESRGSNARVELNAPSKGGLIVELPNDGEPYLPETMNELSDSVRMTSLNPSRSLSCGHSAANANDHYSTPRGGAMAAISYGDRCSYGERHNFLSTDPGTRAANVRKAEAAISDSPTVSVRLPGSSTTLTDDVISTTDDIGVSSEATSLSEMTSGMRITSESRSESLSGTNTSDTATGSRRTSDTTDMSRTSDTTDTRRTSDISSISYTSDTRRTSETSNMSRASDTTDMSRSSYTTDTRRTSETSDMSTRTADSTDTNLNRSSDNTDTSRTSETSDMSTRTADSTDTNLNRSSDNTDISRTFDSTDTNLTSDTTDTNLTSDTTDTNAMDINVSAEPMLNGGDSTDENASSDSESVESELRGAVGPQISLPGRNSFEKPTNVDEVLDLNEKRAADMPESIFALMN